MAADALPQERLCTTPSTTRKAETVALDNLEVL